MGIRFASVHVSAYINLCAVCRVCFLTSVKVSGLVFLPSCLRCDGSLSELHILKPSAVFAAGLACLFAPGAFDALSTCFLYEAYSVRFRMSKSVCIKGLFFVFDAIGALAMCKTDAGRRAYRCRLCRGEH